MTANPRWPEVLASLPYQQSPSDRYDVVARVFKAKLDQLLNDIKNGLLGVQVSRVYAIEFQKRGLPHRMRTLWLRLRTPTVHAQASISTVSAQRSYPLLRRMTMIRWRPMCNGRYARLCWTTWSTTIAQGQRAGHARVGTRTRVNAAVTSHFRTPTKRHWETRQRRPP